MSDQPTSPEPDLPRYELVAVVCRACAMEELLSDHAGAVVILPGGDHAPECDTFAAAHLNAVDPPA